MTTNVALLNLNCVEDFSPLFVLVFHHGHNSPEQAGIYSLQEKATPEELPVDMQRGRYRQLEVTETPLVLPVVHRGVQLGVSKERRSDATV